MSYLVSPGLKIVEHDLSAYVPGVSSSVAAIGGVFSWGPVEERVLISDEETLVHRFGRPSDDNYETFMIATNFLSYSNALYVSRAADANTVNAVAGDVGAQNIQIKNLNDFEVKQPTIDANAYFYARYPSATGNGLRISVCPSADAYSSTLTVPAGTTLDVEFTPNSNTATITVVDSGGDSNVAL